MTGTAPSHRAIRALLAVVVLGACSSPTSGPSATTTAPGVVTPSPAGTGTPTPVPLGRTVEVEVDGAVLRLTLDSVAVLTECPGRAASVQAPALGHFVVLDVTASITTAYAPVGAEMFSITAPDGRTQPVSTTDASWACFEPGELLPPFVDTAEPVSGKVVLDSATEHGTVSYSSGGASGWYWSF